MTQGPRLNLDPEVQQAVNRLTQRQRRLWRERHYPNSLEAIAEIRAEIPMTDGRPKRKARS